MDTDKFQELVLEQLNMLTSEVGKVKTTVANMENRLDSVEKGQQALEKGQQSLQQEVEKIRLSQVRMEFEHGEKLSALFDGYKLLSEKLDDHTNRLQRIEEKITTHDIQIKVLDKTKSNKRKVK